MPVNNSKKLNKNMESINLESHKSKDIKKAEDMIVSAIHLLKDPKGSSLADIKKFLISKHQEDAINGINYNRVLKQAVNRGILSEIDGKYQVAERGRRRTRSRGSPKRQARRSGSKRTSKNRKRSRSASKSRKRGRSASKRTSKSRKRGTSGSRRASKSRRRRNTSGGRQRQSGSSKKRAGSKSRSRRRRTHKGHVEGDDCE